MEVRGRHFTAPEQRAWRIQQNGESCCQTTNKDRSVLDDCRGDRPHRSATSSNVFDALTDQIKKAVGSRGPKTFTIHGIAKIVVQHKPATKERQGTNPFTGEPTTFKAKPARNVVKIRPLKKFKDMVS